MQDFSAFIILFVLSFILSVLMIVCSVIAAPSTKNIHKEQPYECGIISSEDSHIQYNVQFLKYAILFLIFDVETIFIFPYAISFDTLGLFAFAEVSIFITLIMLGLIYVIRKRMLKVK